MEKIELSEIHAHLLGIAKSVDEICLRHNIPYYMVGGTLLGAIRHKGFIPWDDDMDFGVPIEYYDELLKWLEKELPHPYRLCTYQKMEGCGTAFAKVDDSTTCISDPRIPLPLDKQLGLNIDLFPLSYCDKDDTNIKRLRLLQRWKRRIYTESSTGGSIKHMIKVLLQTICPFSHNWFKNKIIMTVKNVASGPYLANLFGIYGEKEFVHKRIYGEHPVRYDFEDTQFNGPMYADSYLTQIYGNYMELPPEDKRHFHASNIYLRQIKL